MRDLVIDISWHTKRWEYRIILNGRNECRKFWRYSKAKRRHQSWNGLWWKWS